MTGKERVPKRGKGLRRGLLAHDAHNIGRCNGSGIGETIQQRTDAEEMVAVPVRSVNRCQIFSAPLDPTR
jgi:hypothetical protein